MNSVLLPWVAELGIITYRSMTGTHFAVAGSATNPRIYSAKGAKRPPLPSEVLATFIIFGAYSVIGNGDGYRSTIGSLLGWGTVLATFLVMSGSPVEGTFPPGKYPQGGLTPDLPNGPNYPSVGGR